MTRSERKTPKRRVPHICAADIGCLLTLLAVSSRQANQRLATHGIRPEEPTRFCNRVLEVSAPNSRSSFRWVRYSMPLRACSWEFWIGLIRAWLMELGSLPVFAYRVPAHASVLRTSTTVKSSPLSGDSSMRSIALACHLDRPSTTTSISSS